MRLTRSLHVALPDDTEVVGLLALMLLVHARHRAASRPAGRSCPWPRQDQSLWDRAAIEEGTALVTAALARGSTGPSRLQAAIAALHDEAGSAEATDWPQIACPLRNPGLPGGQSRSWR